MVLNSETLKAVPKVVSYLMKQHFLLNLPTSHLSQPPWQKFSLRCEMKNEEILSQCCWESRRELSSAGFGADVFVVPRNRIARCHGLESQKQAGSFQLPASPSRSGRQSGRSYSA